MLRSDRLALVPVEGWLSLRMFDQAVYLKMPRHWRWLIHCNVAMMCSVIDQVFFTERV